MDFDNLRPILAAFRNLTCLTLIRTYNCALPDSLVQSPICAHPWDPSTWGPSVWRAQGTALAVGLLAAAAVKKES